MNLDALITKIITGAAPCVLELDLGYSSLPMEFMRGYTDKSEAVRAFNRVVIGTVSDLVPAVSVNVQALLPYGVETIADAVSFAKEKGLFAIADARVSGDEMAAKASAELYFDIMGADCVTVSPYFGIATYAPLFEKAEKEDKCVLVTAHSQDGNSDELSNLVAGMRPVYRAVCEKTAHFSSSAIGKMGYSRIGISLGGLPNSTLGELRRAYKDVLFLVTGYDGYETEAHDINAAFDMRGLGALCSVGRVITAPSGDGAYSERLRKRAEEVIRDLKLCF